MILIRNNSGPGINSKQLAHIDVENMSIESFNFGINLWEHSTMEMRNSKVESPSSFSSKEFPQSWIIGNKLVGELADEAYQRATSYDC